MKQIKLILAILIFSTTAFAQAPQPSDAGSRLENMQRIKIGLITKTVNLTSQQAEKFWPIYNNYSAEQLEIRKARRENMKSMKTNESASQDALNTIMDSKQKELDLQKKYQTEFLRVISAKQLLDLYKAEKQFNEAIARKIMERRQNVGNGPRGNNGGRFKGGNGPKRVQEPNER